MYISDNVKKNNEYLWANVFISWINHELDFDYQAVPVESEESPIDVVAKSQSGAYPDVQLQLTYAIEMPFVAREGMRGAGFSKQPSIDAIERKIKKFTEQGIDMSKIVLIIQGYMAEQAAHKVFYDGSFDRYEQSEFQGIYYVAPPMVEGETGEYLQEGTVVTIKNAFKKTSF